MVIPYYFSLLCVVDVEVLCEVVALVGATVGGISAAVSGEVVAWIKITSSSKVLDF